MEPKKKIRILLLTHTIVFSLIGCGSSTAPVLNENVTEKDGDEIADMFDDGTSTNEITEKMQDEIETVESTEVKAEDTEITETKPVETPTTTPAVPTSTPSPTATPEPTTPPHVHDYAETVTRQPSCSMEGERVLTCSCGDSKMEVIPATGNHNWVENTTVIHYEALGHVESVIVGETAKRTEYECSYCGFRSDTAAGVADHQAVQFEDGIAHAGARTIAYDYPGEPIYENQWVVDQEAHDEVVGIGTYTCTICGATK